MISQKFQVAFVRVELLQVSLKTLAIQFKLIKEKLKYMRMEILFMLLVESLTIILRFQLMEKKKDLILKKKNTKSNLLMGFLKVKLNLVKKK